MGNTKTLRTLSTILGYFARRNVQKCTVPRCNTCILATTRTFVFFSVARQRKENRMSRTCKNQDARTVLSSTPPPMNSRTVCAFLPREFFSCLPGFAHPGHRLHSLVDSFHICLATNSLFSHIYFSNELVLTCDLTLALFIYTSTSCLLYTSPSPRDKRQSRMPSSA